MRARRNVIAILGLGSLLAATIVVSIALHLPEALAGQAPAPMVSRTRGKAMTAGEMRSLIERAAESWTKGNAKAFAALFTPEGEFVVPGQKWVGVAAIEKVAAEFAQSNAQVKITIHRIIIEQQQAVVEWQWHETDNNGKQTQADDAIVVDFVDGKIKRWREYIDSKTPLMHL